MATYLRRDDWVTDAMGNALSGASVYVCSQPATTTSIPPSPEVQLYSDPAGADPITQPVMTDGYGHAFYYAAPGTYTVVYYSPQILETILPDQTIGSGNVTFPITVAEGGTNATTAPQALINLGAAASGANADITSMSAIPNTTFNSSGWTFAAGSFASGAKGAFVADQSWTGTGYSGNAVVVQGTSGAYSLLGEGTITTSGSITAPNLLITTLGTIGALRVGTSSTSSIISEAANIPITIHGQNITSAANSVIIDSGSPTPTAGVGLLGFTTYPTQTTVGGNGSASPAPTPQLWLPVTVGGTEYVIALCKPS